MAFEYKAKTIDERVCPVCKKTFIAAPQHAWKEHGTKGQPKLVCSFTCDLASFRAHQEKLQRNKEQRKKGVKKNV